MKYDVIVIGVGFFGVVMVECLVNQGGKCVLVFEQ